MEICLDPDGKSKAKLAFDIPVPRIPLGRFARLNAIPVYGPRRVRTSISRFALLALAFLPSDTRLSRPDSFPRPFVKSTPRTLSFPALSPFKKILHRNAGETSPSPLLGPSILYPRQGFHCSRGNRSRFYRRNLSSVLSLSFTRNVFAVPLHPRCRDKSENCNLRIATGTLHPRRSREGTSSVIYFSKANLLIRVPGRLPLDVQDFAY